MEEHTKACLSSDSGYFPNAHIMRRLHGETWGRTFRSQLKTVQLWRITQKVVVWLQSWSQRDRLVKWKQDARQTRGFQNCDWKLNGSTRKLTRIAYKRCYSWQKQLNAVIAEEMGGKDFPRKNGSDRETRGQENRQSKRHVLRLKSDRQELCVSNFQRFREWLVWIERKLAPQVRRLQQPFPFSWQECRYALRKNELHVNTRHWCKRRAQQENLG